MTWLSATNWVDDPAALITPDQEAGQLVAANLKRRQASSAWRSIIADGEESTGLVVDFGRVREIQALALAFPRDNDPDVYDATPAIASGDLIRHRLSAVSSGAGELYDSGAVASGVDATIGVHWIKLPAPVSARWWRIDIDAPSRVAEGFLDVARAWAGPVLQPAVGFSYGDNSGWTSPADITRARRGVSEFAEGADVTQTWSMSFEGLSDAERVLFDDFERRVAACVQFLIVRNDRPAGRAAMFARQSASSGIDSLTWRRNRKTLRLVESI